MDLSVRIGSLHLRNPLMAASGCYGYGVEYAEAFHYSGSGTARRSAVEEYIEDNAVPLK